MTEFLHSTAGDISSLLIIIGLLWRIFALYKKFAGYDARIKIVMEEQKIQTDVLNNILDILEDLGHNASEPRAKITNMLNDRAHEVTG